MSRRLSRTLIMGVALVALSISACRAPAGAPEPEEIETVDVGGSIDEELDTSDDPVGYVPLEEVGGVLPVGFTFQDRDLDMWSPMVLTERFLQNRKTHRIFVLARMRPGMDLEKAQKEMDRVVYNLRSQYPGFTASSLSMRPPICWPRWLWRWGF